MSLHHYEQNEVTTLLSGITKMKLTFSHGRTPLSRETTYTYDAVGRLSGKQRQLTGITGTGLIRFPNRITIRDN